MHRGRHHDAECRHALLLASQHAREPDRQASSTTICDFYHRVGVIFFTFEGLPRCHYAPQLSGESHAHNQAFGGCRRPARIRGFWHLRVGAFGQVSRAADRPPLILRTLRSSQSSRTIRVPRTISSTAATPRRSPTSGCRQPFNVSARAFHCLAVFSNTRLLCWWRSSDDLSSPSAYSRSRKPTPTTCFFHASRNFRSLRGC